MTNVQVVKDSLVYAHYDEGQIVYIGIGSNPGRPWACGNNHRSEIHSEFMLSKLRSGDASFAKMIEEGLTRERAEELEVFLIEEINPKFNIKHTEKWKEDQKDRANHARQFTSLDNSKPFMTPKGVFPSMAEAARAYGIRRESMRDRAKSKKNKGKYYYVTT